MSELIQAAGIAAPVLPHEVVDCPPLGGAVKVRALLLSNRLSIQDKCKPQVGGDAGGQVGIDYTVVPEVLAQAVVDGKDQPVYTRARWEVFGAAHPALALQLFNTAWRLSGMSADDAKKN